MPTTRKRRVYRRKGPITRAAESDDYVQQLKAVRDLISKQLDSGTVAPRDMAALTKRYLDVCNEINEIEEKARQKDPALKALHIPPAAVVEESDDSKGGKAQG